MLYDNNNKLLVISFTWAYLDKCVKKEFVYVLLKYNESNGF